jgi:PAS domain S-box-containing protein/putative nucleotidyltransferase with HDIG domain
MPEFLYRFRTRLLLIVIIAILPLIVLTIINSSEARHQAENKVKDDLQNLTMLLSAEEKHIFDDERRLLAGLSSLPETQSRDATACSQRLASFLPANPNNLNLGVIDKDGLIFCSALAIEGPIDVSDRSYFQHALEFKDFSIGDYQIGRITGKASVNFGYPILDENGKVSRVIFGALDLGYLDQLIQEANLPKGATVTLLDRNGIILGRFPETGGQVGEQFTMEPVFNAILHQDGDGSLVSPGLDGVSRLFAFRKLKVSRQATDTFLLIGIPENVAYADANRLLLRNLVGIALASILALVATWLLSYLTIVRPVHSLMAVTRRLASGKLDERVDQVGEQGELSQLAKAFNEMAAALEQHELDMQQAREALRESEQHYRTVFEDVPVGLYRTTPDGEILDVNPALLQMFGYPDLESIRVKNANDIYVNPPDRDRVTLLLKRDGLVRDYETQFRRYDGTLIWARDTVRAIYDAQGRLKFYEGSLQDITGQKLAFEELRRSVMHSQALVQISRRLNAQLDLDTVARAVCEEAARVLNVSTVCLGWYDLIQGRLFHGAAFNLPPESKNWIQSRLVPQDLYQGLVQKEDVIFSLDRWLNELKPVDNPLQSSRFGWVVLAGLIRESELIGTLCLYLEDNQKIDEGGWTFLRSLADQATQAVINACLFKDAQQRSERLASLHRVDIAISSSLEIQVTMDVILEQVTTRLNVDAADFLVFNSLTNTLDFVVGQGFHTEALKHTHLKLGDGYAGIAALEQRMIYIEDLTSQNVDFSRSPLFLEEKFISYFAVPLIAKGSIKGVLEIYHRSHLDPNNEWLEFLESLAGQAAIAVDSTMLFDGLQRKNLDLSLAYETTLEGWSRALDLRDKDTEGHTQRVTQLTLRLARELNMNDADLVHTRRGALLHDIGKMGVPDDILHKPGPLTEEEWEIMRKHPVYAFELLTPIEFLRSALDIPYCHHEKWDGTGYPRGLKGLQIPLPARIFAVADVWDALTSHRPYRKAWTEEQALEYIQRQAGLHFDPQVVEVFLKVMNALHPVKSPALPD